MSRRAVAAWAPALVLLGACVSEASAQTLPDSLAGTAWRLIEFRSPEDDTSMLRPPTASLYTMTLAANGTVTMRLDCNRASGTWTASAAGGSFGFGELRMTRAVCQQPSLDTQIARHAEYVSSYRIRDGLLYLSLSADGGTYVWEPLRD
jgi:heat shock protein HslJ